MCGRERLRKAYAQDKRLCAKEEFRSPGWPRQASSGWRRLRETLRDLETRLGSAPEACRGAGRCKSYLPPMDRARQLVLNTWGQRTAKNAALRKARLREVAVSSRTY